jgi:AhpC/TSA family/Thiol:disulfide interchange protein DsbD, N-terminal
MTQLVELQQVLSDLQAAGYQPYAVSNDTIERLAAFAERNNITYPLLSDEDSAVIKRYGILNTLIAPGEGKAMRWYGIPYPGTYVTNADGVIVQKDFHRHHARRASGRTLLHQVTGTVPDSDDSAVQVRAGTEGPEVAIEAYLTEGALRLEVLSTLVCRVRIRRGLHLYADGAPEAFTPASLTINGTGIRAGEPSWPTPNWLAMAAVGGTVPVWEGNLSVTVPLTATSEIIRLGHGIERTKAAIEVRLEFQACDEVSCMLPQSIGIELEAPLATLVEPEGLQTYVDRVQQAQWTPTADVRVGSGSTAPGTVDPEPKVRR